MENGRLDVEPRRTENGKMMESYNDNGKWQRTGKTATMRASGDDTFKNNDDGKWQR
jgi:hypothetical protein